MALLAFKGIGASPGVAVGRASLYRRSPVIGSALQDFDARATLPAGVRDAEIERLREARITAAEQLALLTADLGVRIGPAEAAVFEAQAMFLDDPALVEPMEQAIRDRGVGATQASAEVLSQAARDLEALSDPYLMARAADVRDIQERLVGILEASPVAALPEQTDPLRSAAHNSSPPAVANPAPSLGFPATGVDSHGAGYILIADDLTPSDTVGLDPETVAGIVLAGGTPLAHASILARGLGLPLVVDAGEQVWRIEPGQQILIDGTEGTVLVEPEEPDRARYQERITASAVQHFDPSSAAHGPAYTADGRRIELLANVSSPAEARLAANNRAEGVGLLRTEFLLASLTSTDLSRDLNEDPLHRPSLEAVSPAENSSVESAPSEQALTEAYGSIFAVMGDCPIVVRAMDVGGDKPLPFLNMNDEANPFLGWRGIRVLLDEPDLFAAQIRAALRAANAHGTDLRLMLPMVTGVDEFIRARRFIEKVQHESGIELSYPLRIGAMIEVPSAAIVADALAREADFFSVGTNDLTQYVLAADRTNPRVRSLCRLLHPAVLRLIDTTVRAANAERRPVAVCGEAAGTVPDMLLLVGLGVDELSMGPARLPEVREFLSTVSYEALRSLAKEALSKATADEVDELIQASGYMAGN